MEHSTAPEVGFHLKGLMKTLSGFQLSVKSAFRFSTKAVIPSLRSSWKKKNIKPVRSDSFPFYCDMLTEDRGNFFNFPNPFPTRIDHYVRERARCTYYIWIRLESLSRMMSMECCSTHRLSNQNTARAPWGVESAYQHRVTSRHVT